jgi:two-component system response regulator
MGKKGDEMLVSKRPILLVEDNPDDVTLTLRAMNKAGILNEIVVTEDGAEALEWLHGPEVTPLPAMVLLDLKLPKVDGLEVLRAIRANERTALLPVVVLTTSREERDVAQGYRLRVNSYIRKPVDFNRFADAVAQIGVYWLLLNEHPAGSKGS